LDRWQRREPDECPLRGMMEKAVEAPEAHAKKSAMMEAVIDG
jgi:hypothetical protein